MSEHVVALIRAIALGLAFMGVFGYAINQEQLASPILIGLAMFLYIGTKEKKND